MTQINEPYYDTDPANKAYVDKVNGKTVAFVGTKSKNFGIQPEPPYHVNDTYMDGNDIYICIKDRELGSFDSSDWKLATTYTNDDVANSKNKVFITQPQPPYNKGDLWTTGPNGELRRCVNSRATGSYVESDWENATAYDNTHTVIENGLVTAGTIQVANGGTVAAGMTGNESGDNAVRFWSGATSGNKNNAPFRVLQNGSVFMTKANITGGTIKVHGNQTQSLIKAYVDGYEDSVYSEITPNYISIYNDLSHKYGSLGNMFGDLTLQISEQVDSNNSVMSSLNSSSLMILKQSGSNQISTLVKPEEIETPKIVAGNIDCGTCTLNSSSDTTVSFNKTFASPPIVVLTPKVNGTAVGACYSASVVRTTTTDFTAYCLTNLNSSGNVAFNWIAIET